MLIISVNVKVEQIIDTYLFEVIPGKHVFIVTYGCELKDGFSPKISHEHQELGLHSISQLKSINLPVGYASSYFNLDKN